MSGSDDKGFLTPTAAERLFNRIFGLLIGLGLGLKHNYLLQVRGRKKWLGFTTKAKGRRCE